MTLFSFKPTTKHLVLLVVVCLVIWLVSHALIAIASIIGFVALCYLFVQYLKKVFQKKT